MGIGIEAIIAHGHLTFVWDMGDNPGDEVQVIHSLCLFCLFPILVADLAFYNHGYFRKFLDLEIKKSLRQRYPISLIMIDIDNFKVYNDTYGHPIGDIVLQELAQVLRNSVREVYLVARYGGDEFAVVLPYSDEMGGLRVAERIDKAIKAGRFSPKAPARGTQLTVSMGVSCYPQDAFHVDELIHTADQKLYGAKVKGKNQISA